MGSNGKTGNAYIHGIAQGMAKTAMGRIGPCSAELKADMDRRLDFRAPASR